jgi:hypothetical protein
MFQCEAFLLYDDCYVESDALLLAENTLRVFPCNFFNCSKFCHCDLVTVAGLVDREWKTGMCCNLRFCAAAQQRLS